MDTHPSSQVVGSRRVSSTDQRTDRQDLGDVDRAFADQVSGSSVGRPALESVLTYVRDGDTVRVRSMDRLARSLIDLANLVQRLAGDGVTVEFIMERLTFRPGGDDPYATFQLHMLGAVAQLERSLIREGIAKAKSRGVYQGRTPTLTAEQAADVRSRVAAGVPKAKIIRDMGCLRATVNRALAE